MQQRRRTFMLFVILTATIALLNGCTADRVHSTGNGNNNASATNSAGVGNSSNTGARDGIGPKDTGIGGTSEGNANSAVKSNSNVEPTGVNKNAGRGANANKP
jgi:hypothetical protein